MWDQITPIHISSPVQRLQHGLRVGFRDAQEGAGRAFGAAVALFPVLEGAVADADESGKLRWPADDIPGVRLGVHHRVRRHHTLVVPRSGMRKAKRMAILPPPMRPRDRSVATPYFRTARRRPWLSGVAFGYAGINCRGASPGQVFRPSPLCFAGTSFQWEEERLSATEQKWI